MSDMTFTDEVRRSLEGLLPCTVNSYHKFTPKIFSENGIDKKYWPIFQMKTLNARDMEEAQRLTDYATAENKIEICGTYDFVRKKVVGWENLIDIIDGSKIEYKRDSEKNTDPNLFQEFPVKLVMQLYSELFVISGVSEREDKALTS